MTIPVKLGVVMDPITAILPEKDTTLAFLLAAQKRGWQIHYMEQHDLYVDNGCVGANMKTLTVYPSEKKWFKFKAQSDQPLNHLDVILMRKDPPFDMEFIYTTYLLELAQKDGVLVVNNPQSLRDANEKFFTTWFPQCCPPTLVSRDNERIHQFIQQHEEVILKPLAGMGGHNVFRTQKNDPNVNVIIEALSQNGANTIMAQHYIPAITTHGDKRILVVDGKPIPYGLARIPGPGDHRGNLAVGATGKVVKINARDRWICEQVAPTLREKGLMFVGLDVIGDYLTEINVTSPTCVREIEAGCDSNICELLLDSIAKRLT